MSRDAFEGVRDAGCWMLDAGCWMLDVRHVATGDSTRRDEADPRWRAGFVELRSSFINLPSTFRLSSWLATLNPRLSILNPQQKMRRPPRPADRPRPHALSLPILEMCGSLRRPVAIRNSGERLLGLQPNRGPIGRRGFVCAERGAIVRFNLADLVSEFSNYFWPPSRSRTRRIGGKRRDFSCRRCFATL